jgi:superfamily II DNA/RNA helicase
MPKIAHFLTPVPAHVREVFLIIMLEEIMNSSEFAQVLIFTKRCDTTETLALILRKLKFKTAMLHSKMEQDERLKAVVDFKAARQRVLVATDVAARGLDIPFVDHVIHFNAPPSATIYVHRAGRTGRAGRSGRSVLFVNRAKDAEIVDEIEALLGQQFEVLEVDERQTTGKMKDVLTAKKDAKMAMFDNQFGERDKKLQSIRAAKVELAPDFT